MGRLHRDRHSRVGRRGLPARCLSCRAMKTSSSEGGIARSSSTWTPAASREAVRRSSTLVRAGRCSAGAQAQVQPVAEGRHVFDVGIRAAAPRARPRFGCAISISTRPASRLASSRWAALHQDAAVAHEAQPIAAGRLVHVGRADHHRHALGQQADDQLPEVLARDRVDAGGRLVEQQQARAMDQRAGQPQLLFHARPKAGRPAGARSRSGRRSAAARPSGRSSPRRGTERTVPKKFRFSCTVSSS